MLVVSLSVALGRRESTSRIRVRTYIYILVFVLLYIITDLGRDRAIIVTFTKVLLTP